MPERFPIPDEVVEATATALCDSDLGLTFRDDTAGVCACAGGYRDLAGRLRLPSPHRAPIQK